MRSPPPRRIGTTGVRRDIRPPPAAPGSALKQTLLTTLCLVASIAPAGELGPTIDEVAGDRLELLHSTTDWRIFSITIAAGGTLADHATGPRAIVTLTGLEIQALKGDADPTTAKPWQAMWLTNTFSRGFENIGDETLSYLVIEARDRDIQAEDSDRGCDVGETLLTNSELSICRIGERSSGLTIELSRPSWLYSPAPLMAADGDSQIALPIGTHTLRPASSPVVVVELGPD